MGSPSVSSRVVHRFVWPFRSPPRSLQCSTFQLSDVRLVVMAWHLFRGLIPMIVLIMGVPPRMAAVGHRVLTVPPRLSFLLGTGARHRKFLKQTVGRCVVPWLLGTLKYPLLRAIRPWLEPHYEKHVHLPLGQLMGHCVPYLLMQSVTVVMLARQPLLHKLLVEEPPVEKREPLKMKPAQQRHKELPPFGISKPS